MEKLLLGHLFRLGMVADEDDLHVVVLRAQEAHHPEVEAPGDVLLEFPHTARNIHHRYNYSIRLIAYCGFPHFKSKVFRLDILELRLTFGRIALQILHNGALLVQVVEGAFLAHIGKAYGFGLEFLLAFLFEVGQAEVLEDHCSQLFHCDFGLVIVVAGFFARVSLFTLAGARLLRYDIANFTFAIALAGVLLATGVEAEAIFVERANGYTHHLFAVRENDALFTDDILQVFLNGLANLLFMAFLVNLTFTMQGPVMLGDRHGIFSFFTLYDILLGMVPGTTGRCPVHSSLIGSASYRYSVGSHSHIHGNTHVLS